MAALNFPNSPGGQTPANTFSPTSTPDSSTNGVTYIYNSTNDTWTAQTSDSSNLYLSKITNDVAAGVISFTTGLNVNGTSVINLQPNGNASISGTLTAGTYAGLPTASTSGSGIVQLSTSTSSTDQTTAATTSAAKTAYDRGSEGVSAAATANAAASSAATAASNAQGTADSALSTANSANSAAAAAQSTANAALPKSGGTISGSLNVTGTVTGGAYSGLPISSTSQQGIVGLVTSVTSTSTTQAATPSSAKAAYDRGTEGVNNAASASSAAATAQGTANSASSAASAAANAASAAQNTANSADALANTANNTANAAMPKAGGTFTGAVTVSAGSFKTNAGIPANFDAVARFRNTSQDGTITTGGVVNDGVSFCFGTERRANFMYQPSNTSFTLRMDAASTKFIIQQDSGGTYNTIFTFNRSNGNFIAAGKVTGSNITAFATTLAAQAAAATDVAGLKSAIANALAVLNNFTAAELQGD